MPIDNAVAYFEQQTGLTIPRRERRTCAYEFWADTEPNDFALLTVTLGGPNIAFTFVEGLGNDTRPVRGNGNPYNIVLEGFIAAESGDIQTWLIKNGDKELNDGDGIDLNPASVFANFKAMPFRSREVSKKDGRHLAVGERDPA